VKNDFQFISIFFALETTGKRRMDERYSVGRERVRVSGHSFGGHRTGSAFGTRDAFLLFSLFFQSRTRITKEPRL